MHARHLAELGFLQDALEELGLSCSLVERSREVPLSTLMVNIEGGTAERPRQLALSFYPTEPGQFENTLLLQYFLPLPTTFDPEGADRIRQVLPEINNRLVLGHFSITSGEPQLHYRYVQPLPADEMVNSDVIKDVLVILTFTPILFADLLEATASGRLTVAEAQERINTIYNR
jgi:hypothetical protein